MSVNVYYRKEDVPSSLKYILHNDAIFCMRGRVPMNPVTDRILSFIENAKLSSERYFVSNRHPEFGGIRVSDLSTGCKTAINAYMSASENYCIDTISCGENAIEAILELTDGNIVYKNYHSAIDGDKSCDILFNGSHYNTIDEFMEAITEYEESIE